MTREHGTLSGYWTSTSLGEHQAVAIEMKEDEDASNIADGVNLIERYEDIMDSYQIRLVHSPIPSLQDKWKRHKHIGISKSRYTLFRQCPKALWLKTYKPELIVINDSLQQRFQSGSAVGDLAMGLFGEFVEVTSYTSDGKVDLSRMADYTQKYIAAGVDVICEASFFYDGGYCAVDILKKENGGYAIYEVKSSTDADKEVYAQDVLQKYILVNNGINVTGTYLVCINSAYVLEGELDIHGLFQVQDISEAVAQNTSLVASQVAQERKCSPKWMKSRTWVWMSTAINHMTVRSGSTAHDIFQSSRSLISIG